MGKYINSLNCDKSGTHTWGYIQSHPTPPGFWLAAGMYVMVKAMPGPPEWKSKVITLPDTPDEPQTLYYQDLIACTHYLFKWSDLAKHMDYIPMQVFKKNNNHIYHEMCSGHKWSKQQVGCKFSWDLQVNPSWLSVFKAQLVIGTMIVRARLRLGTCYVLVLMELWHICGMDTQGDKSLLDAWAEML